MDANARSYLASPHYQMLWPLRPPILKPNVLLAPHRPTRPTIARLHISLLSDPGAYPPNSWVPRPPVPPWRRPRFQICVGLLPNIPHKKGLLMTLDQSKRIQRILEMAPRLKPPGELYGLGDTRHSHADLRAIILPWYRQPLIILWGVFIVLWILSIGI